VNAQIQHKACAHSAHLLRQLSAKYRSLDPNLDYPRRLEKLVIQNRLKWYNRQIRDDSAICSTGKWRNGLTNMLREFLAPQHGAPWGCEWRIRHPDMEGSCK
jgi:hypothetical protein